MANGIPDIEKLIKLIMMTTSDKDGEALVAVRKANAYLAQYNKNWQEVLRGKVPMVNGTSARPREEAKRESANTHTPPWEERPAEKLWQTEPTHPETEMSRYGLRYVGLEIEGYFEILAQRQLGSFQEFVQSVFEFWRNRGYLTEKQYSVIRSAAEGRKK